MVRASLSAISSNPSSSVLSPTRSARIGLYRERSVRPTPSSTGITRFRKLISTPISVSVQKRPSNNASVMRMTG